MGLIKNNNGLKIFNTSYEGTGNMGINTACSIESPFEPKLIFYTGYINSANKFYKATGQIDCSILKNEYVNGMGLGSDSYGKKEGNTISWYSDKDPSAQLNSTGLTYYFVVIG